MNLLRRLANLEHLTRALGRSRCAECAGLPDYAVDWPESTAAAPVTCPRCSWQQEQIRVEYVNLVDARHDAKVVLVGSEAESAIPANIQSPPTAAY